MINYLVCSVFLLASRTVVLEEGGVGGGIVGGYHELSICSSDASICRTYSAGLGPCSQARSCLPAQTRESSESIRDPDVEKQLADFTVTVCVCVRPLLSSRAVVILLLQLARLSVAGQVTVWLFSRASAPRIMGLSGGKDFQMRRGCWLATSR